MSSTVISVENLSKSYRLGQIGTGTLSSDLNAWWAKVRGKPNPMLKIGEKDHGNRDGETIWALKDVSFTVEQGEALGIIGRNGAGKSTLLKILARVTAPTSGRVRVRGRIASLLEVGTGFHPDLTGRENIYLNGAIMGMTRQEVRRKLDEIVAFAEIEKFIDTPVKRYSSGMYVRLAFAVAAHLDPEILVVDEVLAVGDAEFQKKCLGKMGDVAKEGRTVLFVSHNMTAVQSLCSNGIVLHKGRIIHEGPIDYCVSSYLVTKEKRFQWKKEEFKNLPLEIIGISIFLNGEQPNIILNVKVDLRSNFLHKSAFMALDINNSLGNTIMQAIPKLLPFISSEISNHVCDVQIELPPLVPGRYSLAVWVGSHNTQTLDDTEDCVYFDIENPPTKGRSFPYSASHGFIVPISRIFYNSKLISDRL